MGWKKDKRLGTGGRGSDSSQFHSTCCTTQMSDDLDYLNDILNKPAASSASSNGVSTTTSAPPLDMAALKPILDALKAANGTSDDDLSQLDEASIGTMLAKLDQAGVAADGIEARLDSLLGELDGMLEGLETLQPSSVTATEGSKAEASDKEKL